MAIESKRSVQPLRNWSAYNPSLVERGSITLWFDETVLATWEHTNAYCKVGRPFTYSDRAVETLLIIRELFRLPYRQTEGFARSLLSFIAPELTVPDFTSLAKRAAKLQIQLGNIPRRGAVHVVIDSTGFKVFGEGEWKTRQHGWTKRRTWRKLHLCIDPDTHEILAESLTGNNVHDADQVEPLLATIEGKIKTCGGDKAYDKHKVYRALAQRKIQPCIPPQHNARIKRHGNAAGLPLPRDEAIRGIRQHGRAEWKRRVGYHRRSLAETAMFRVKTIFGPTLKNRSLENQRPEARLRCKILNRFTNLPGFV